MRCIHCIMIAFKGVLIKIALLLLLLHDYCYSSGRLSFLLALKIAHEAFGTLCKKYLLFIHHLFTIHISPVSIF